MLCVSCSRDTAAALKEYTGLDFFVSCFDPEKGQVRIPFPAVVTRGSGQLSHVLL